ncbi:putative F420-0 ABC transporter substrate-binding protein [Rathayibacter soli]|uniref:putative F420-0 ABC transporter substrate-binding protein n=1 Tax=Rathayibacter soli TaxID=3144168 RepID=UPI0027E59514|nr:putative F420-0 ABC transporter substrate-binding protein [Glaciibacter superstes]
MRAPIRTVSFVGAAALALILSGCSAAASEQSVASASATVSPAASGPIDNCGTTVTVGAAPKRIVTIKSSTTELLLALGLGKRIVGSAFLDGPIPASLAGHGTPKVISDFLPGQEAVLALQPDFIYAGWESNFSADGVGERASLAQLGIGTYVSPSACKEAAFMPDPLTFDTVFTEIDQAGRVFGASAAAQKLVTQQKAQLHALTPPKKTVSALWYSSGSTTPYVGAGIGAPEMIMRASGLKNVFSNVHDTWSSVSWEAVAAANPHVIVVVDADWNTAKSKISALEANPVTKNLDAVVNHRFIVLPFASTEAGVRNVQAAASVIQQLKKVDG